MSNTNVSHEVMDLTDLFPEVTPESESTLFTKKDETIDLTPPEEDEIPPVVVPDKTVKPAAAEPVVAPAKTTPASVTAVPTLEDLETATEEMEAAKETKGGLKEFFKSKIEAGELNTFSDYDEKTQTIDEYLGTFKPKDYDELWKVNLEAQKADIAEKLPQEFYDSLPGELQYAAKYVADGGTDLKGLFQVLAQVEGIKELDPVKDADKICETYLTAKEFGTPEEIADQIAEWKDLGVLDKKSTGFKPQLDKMQETIVQNKLAAQEDIKKNQALQAEYYHDNVIEALRTEDLNGIKIDKKTQISLYKGLTEGSFVDSRGKRCTEFEHLLDNAMWGKTPNYTLLAKVQWLLKDEAGYEKALANKAINGNVEETARTLKTEQAKNKAAAVESAAPAAKKMVRPGTGLFNRR